MQTRSRRPVMSGKVAGRRRVDQGTGESCRKNSQIVPGYLPRGEKKYRRQQQRHIAPRASHRQRAARRKKQKNRRNSRPDFFSAGTPPFLIHKKKERQRKKQKGKGHTVRHRPGKPEINLRIDIRIYHGQKEKHKDHKAQRQKTLRRTIILPAASRLRLKKGKPCPYKRRQRPEKQECVSHHHRPKLRQSEIIDG